MDDTGNDLHKPQTKYLWTTSFRRNYTQLTQTERHIHWWFTPQRLIFCIDDTFQYTRNQDKYDILVKIIQPLNKFGVILSSKIAQPTKLRRSHLSKFIHNACTYTYTQSLFTHNATNNIYTRSSSVSSITNKNAVNCRL